MMFSDAELEAYLDEALAPRRMADVEAALRSDALVSQRLSTINGRRDNGIHSVGEIWRQHRLSCPDRDELGGYLLSALDDELVSYIEFHLAVVCCRFCQANVEDLKSRQSENTENVESRRRKYFQSSAGYLPRD